ncbi:MAG TPA: hypothetical protein PKC21_02285 [Oligoflexia bacterium]|nr:hypothetical protein [Oligoflexia bacterium]HMR24159.1 hypothetical protein [Oligoflexia bacterium]
MEKKMIDDLFKEISLEKEDALSNLDELIILQQKAYKLLRFLDKAMNEGFISPKGAHNFMSMNKAAESWIKQHIKNFPQDARPDIGNQQELGVFCNLFATFLDISFDIDKNPGKKLYSEGAHCFCSMCSYLVNVSHLKTKKISKAEKNRAKKIKHHTLIQLCLNNNLDIADETISQIVESKDCSEDLAILAYVGQLIDRAKGISNGPAVLCLYREFAWKNSGPKKNFTFNASLVHKATNDLLIQVRSRQKKVV